MKTKLHTVIRTLIFVFLIISLSNDEIYGQNEGVIKVRKAKKESLIEGISLGLRLGPSYMMYGNTRVLINEYGKEFSSWSTNNVGPSKTSSSGIYRESTFDFPGYNYGAYVNIPLSKNFQFVSEVGYRSGQADFNIKYYNFYNANSDNVIYQFSTKFRYSQLEVPLLLKAQLKGKRLEPFVIFGIAPIINLKSQRITTVDSMSAPQYYKDEMVANNYPVETNVTSLNDKVFNFALTGGFGSKVRLSDRFKLSAEFRFVRMLNNNVFLKYQNNVVKESRMDALSVTLGVEYVLGK